MNIVYFVIALVLMLPGLLGVLLPILPGIPYMFVVALLYGLATKFRPLSTKEIIILGVITGLSVLVDHLSGVLGARWGGAHKKSLLAGFLGLIVGLILFPPFGGIIGLFLAVLVTEIAIHDDNRRAVKAATGSLLGSFAGMLISALLSILFLVLFVIFAIK